MSIFGATEWATPNQEPNTFAPTGLDIDQWLDACVSAGMTYATLTTKHHDGFALWPTEFAVDGYDPYSIAQTTWYANNGNPDVVSLFVTKCRTRGLNPCLYFSIWDATFEARAGVTPSTGTTQYVTMIKQQLSELLTNYGNIGAIWTDGWGWKYGYTYIDYNDIKNYIHAIQPACLLVENSHTHPTLTSEVEVYEVGTDGSIPNGNTRLSEEVGSIRVNGVWFWHPLDGQADVDYTAAATLLSTIANANNNAGTYQLGLSPGTDGHLPAAQVTRLGQLGA